MPFPKDYHFYKKDLLVKKPGEASKSQSKKPEAEGGGGTQVSKQGQTPSGNQPNKHIDEAKNKLNEGKEIKNQIRECYESNSENPEVGLLEFLFGSLKDHQENLETIVQKLYELNSPEAEQLANQIFEHTSEIDYLRQDFAEFSRDQKSYPEHHRNVLNVLKSNQKAGTLDTTPGNQDIATAQKQAQQGSDSQNNNKKSKSPNEAEIEEEKLTDAKQVQFKDKQEKQPVFQEAKSTIISAQEVDKKRAQEAQQREQQQQQEVEDQKIEDEYKKRASKIKPIQHLFNSSELYEDMDSPDPEQIKKDQELAKRQQQEEQRKRDAEEEKLRADELAEQERKQEEEEEERKQQQEQEEERRWQQQQREEQEEARRQQEEQEARDRQQATIPEDDENEPYDDRSDNSAGRNRDSNKADDLKINEEDELRRSNQSKQAKSGSAKPYASVFAGRSSSETAAKNKALAQSMKLESLPTSQRFAKELKLIESSLKATKERASDLSDIKNSIKRSFINAKRKPPAYQDWIDQTMLKQLQVDLETLKKERQDLLIENQELKASPTHDKESKMKLEMRLVEVQKQCEQYQKDIDSLTTKNSELEDMIAQLDEELAEVKNDHLDGESVNTLKSDNRQLLDKVRQLERDLADSKQHNTTNRTENPAVRDHLEAQELKNKISEISEEKDWLHNTLSDVRAQNEVLAKKLSDLEELHNSNVQSGRGSVHTTLKTEIGNQPVTLKVDTPENKNNGLQHDNDKSHKTASIFGKTREAMQHGEPIHDNYLKASQDFANTSDPGKTSRGSIRITNKQEVFNPNSGRNMLVQEMVIDSPPRSKNVQSRRSPTAQKIESIKKATPSTHKKRVALVQKSSRGIL